MPEEKGKYEVIGQQIGQLVDRKNQAYGDAFGKTEQILKTLYPLGIAPGQYADLGFIVRMLDKVSRITSDAGAFGESPYGDIAGYGLLAEAKWREREGGGQLVEPLEEPMLIAGDGHE